MNNNSLFRKPVSKAARGRVPMKSRSRNQKHRHGQNPIRLLRPNLVFAVHAIRMTDNPIIVIEKGQKAGIQGQTVWEGCWAGILLGSADCENRGWSVGIEDRIEDGGEAEAKSPSKQDLPAYARANRANQKQLQTCLRSPKLESTRLGLFFGFRVSAFGF